MQKLCCFFKKLKSDEFTDEKELVNYLLYKIIENSNFTADIFCIRNEINNENENINILELTEEEFEKKIDASIDDKSTFSLSTEYIPADILYLTEHSQHYNETTKKPSRKSFLMNIFNRKSKVKTEKTFYKQTISVNKAKIIFTPSIILKNDIINSFSLDGQKIYLLPPALLQMKKIKMNKNDIFTFYTEVKEENFDGIFIFLKAINKLKDIEFKVKIATDFGIKIPLLIKYCIKLFKIEDKIEFIEKNSDNRFEDIDCVVLPDKIQSFGFYALKAMAYGKIVLVSSRCGIKDIIETDNNGFIFDITKNEVMNLKRAMQYILVNKDDFDNMSQKAIFTVSTYNFESFKKEFLRIVKNIV